MLNFLPRKNQSLTQVKGWQTIKSLFSFYDLELFKYPKGSAVLVISALVLEMSEIISLIYLKQSGPIEEKTIYKIKRFFEWVFHLEVLDKDIEMNFLIQKVMLAYLVVKMIFSFFIVRDSSIESRRRLANIAKLEILSLFYFIDCYLFMIPMMLIAYHQLFYGIMIRKTAAILMLFMLGISTFYEASFSFDFAFRKKNHLSFRNKKTLLYKYLGYLLTTFYHQLDASDDYSILINFLIIGLLALLFNDYYKNLHFSNISNIVEFAYLVYLSLPIALSLSAIMNSYIGYEYADLDNLSVILSLFICQYSMVLIRNRKASILKKDLLKIEDPVEIIMYLEMLNLDTPTKNIAIVPTYKEIDFVWAEHRLRCINLYCFCWTLRTVSSEDECLFLESKFKQIMIFNIESTEEIKEKLIKYPSSRVNTLRTNPNVETDIDIIQKLKASIADSTEENYLHEYSSHNFSSLYHGDSLLKEKTSFEARRSVCFDEEKEGGLKDDDSFRVELDAKYIAKLYKITIFSIYNTFLNQGSKARDSFRFITSYLSFSIFELRNMVGPFIVAYSYLFREEIASTHLSSFEKIIISNYIKCLASENGQDEDKLNIFEEIMAFANLLEETREHCCKAFELVFHYFEEIKDYRNSKDIKRIITSATALKNRQTLLKSLFKKLFTKGEHNLNALVLYGRFQTKIKFSSRKDIIKTYRLIRERTKFQRRGIKEDTGEREETFFQLDPMLVQINLHGGNYTVHSISRNASKALGYSENELIGGLLDPLLPSEIAPKHNNMINKFLNRGCNPSPIRKDTIWLRSYAKRKDGALIPIKTFFRVIFSVNTPVTLCSIIYAKRPCINTVLFEKNGNIIECTRGIMGEILSIPKHMTQPSNIFLQVPSLIKLLRNQKLPFIEETQMYRNFSFRKRGRKSPNLKNPSTPINAEIELQSMIKEIRRSLTASIKVDEIVYNVAGKRWYLATFNSVFETPYYTQELLIWIAKFSKEKIFDLLSLSKNNYNQICNNFSNLREASPN